MTLQEILEKANPDDWAENINGELARFSFELAQYVLELQSKVSVLTEEISELKRRIDYSRGRNE